MLVAFRSNFCHEVFMKSKPAKREELELNVETDVNDEEIDCDRIRGDAIGDTVYSERFVLRVLIQLSQDLETTSCCPLFMTHSLTTRGQRI
ncbi:hypothetical protein J6590_103511 [Homalodisca vitripennis]|nr:hypothetical protein J6590_103511 [Homalodisca vitripennis]